MASYLPTVPPLEFATKRLLPDNASPQGALSPVMKLALIAAPVVALYSPTVLLRPFVTKMAVPSPDNATPPGPLTPVMKVALISAPVVASYSSTASAWLT